MFAAHLDLGQMVKLLISLGADKEHVLLPNEAAAEAIAGKGGRTQSLWWPRLYEPRAAAATV